MDEAPIVPTEISIIKKDIQTLIGHPDIQSGSEAVKARIIHNYNLVSMEGVAPLVNLLELNLSCNVIVAIEGLHQMRNLRVLNLSTNKIKVINGLTGLYSLEKLDLSFNRISSLMNMSQLYGPQYPFFVCFEIRGNAIANLRELNYLAGCQFLRDVSLQGQQGNPVCNSMEYPYAMLAAVPSLQFLDRKAVSALNIQQRPEPIAPPPIREVSPKPQSPKKADTTLKETAKVDKPVHQLPAPNVVQREFQAELLRLQREYEQLFEDNKDLLLKYDQNDKYWMERCQRLDYELREKTEAVGDLQRQVMKLTKNLSARESRLENAEADLAKVNSVRDARDKVIEDLHGKMAQVMKDLGEAQRTAQNAVEDSYRYRDKMEAIERTASELRVQLKQAEQTIGQLHEKTVESSNTALQRFEECQRRLDTAEVKSEQVENENNTLKARIKELLELNTRLEQVWEGKVREAESVRDHTLATMKLEVAQIASQERERAHTSILQEKEKFLFAQRDLEDDWRKKVLVEQDKVRELIQVLQNLEREKADLQSMLKMSVDKEARSKGLIEELTDLVKQMQESIDSERKESLRIKNRAEEEIAKYQKQADACQLESEKLSKRLAVIQSQVGEDETVLVDKTREAVKLRREVQELNHRIEELEETHRRAKTKWEKADFAYAEESTALQQKVSELEERVATQNVIIDDQNDSIKRYKSKLQEQEDQLDSLQGQREQGKINLETKLRDAYDENERVQKKLQEAENYIQELEEQLEQLTTKRNSDKETIKTLNAELQDKAAAIELIEREVLSLQEARRGEEADAIAERNHIIDDLKRYRDELMTSIAAKDKEIKERSAVMRSMQTRIETLETEVRQCRAREEEMEKEIKVLLLELDRKKHKLAEAVKTIGGLVEG